MNNFTQTEVDRFWKYVTKLTEDECWPWDGSISHNGYGVIYIGRKMMRAHRVSFLIHGGVIPDGLWVCHHCDNRKCCNPKHLYTGTAQDNTDDMVAKGRSRHPKGSEHPCAKMSEAQVEEIKRLLADGVSTGEVAKRFNLRRPHVYQIASGQKWKHVLPELMPIIKEKVAANYLTEDSICEMMRMWSVDGISQSDIARKFQVSPPTVCRILKGIQRGRRVLSYA